MGESYEIIGNSLDDVVAQQQGVRETVDRATEHAQEAAEGAQDTEVLAAKSSPTGTRLEERRSVPPARHKIASSLIGDRRTRIKGFLARRKDAFAKKKAQSKELLDQ